MRCLSLVHNLSPYWNLITEKNTDYSLAPGKLIYRSKLTTRTVLWCVGLDCRQTVLKTYYIHYMKPHLFPRGVGREHSYSRPTVFYHQKKWRKFLCYHFKLPHAHGGNSNKTMHYKIPCTWKHTCTRMCAMRRRIAFRFCWGPSLGDIYGWPLACGFKYLERETQFWV